MPGSLAPLSGMKSGAARAAERQIFDFMHVNLRLCV